MSNIRRVCVFPWESPSYCARYAEERSVSVQATELHFDKSVTTSAIDHDDQSGTESSPPVKRTIPDPLGEIPYTLTQEQTAAAEHKLQQARDYATKVGVRGLGHASEPQLALTVSYADLIRGPYAAQSPPSA